MTMPRDYMAEARQAVKDGNWLIRSDNDGYSRDGFKWAGRGKWTVAPDWDPEPVSGGGLYGQGPEASGFGLCRDRLIFCKTRGPRIAVGDDKVKVREAAILLINELPDNLSVGGGLDLGGTQITHLPDNLSVGGYLDLEGTQITQLPDNLSVGGGLYLVGTQITHLPDNLSVGGSLDLRDTQITQLPDNLSVGGSLNLEGTQIKAASVPEHLKDRCRW